MSERPDCPISAEDLALIDAAPLAGTDGDTDDLDSDGQVIRSVPTPPAPGRLARQSVAAPLPEPEPISEAGHGDDA